MTNLIFKADGSGTLVVPAKKFAFAWSLEEDKLSLSFEDSSVRDVVYTVSKAEGVLSITENERKVRFNGISAWLSRETDFFLSPEIRIC